MLVTLYQTLSCAPNVAREFSAGGKIVTPARCFPAFSSLASLLMLLCLLPNTLTLLELFASKKNDSGPLQVWLRLLLRCLHPTLYYDKFQFTVCLRNSLLLGLPRSSVYPVCIPALYQGTACALIATASAFVRLFSGHASSNPMPHLFVHQQDLQFM